MIRRRGMSLVEVLVTVTVMSVLVTLAFEVFRTGVGLQVAGREESRADETLWPALHEITREMQGAVPIYSMNGEILHEAVRASDRLEFHEVDPGRVAPLRMEDFVATDPSCYRQVCFYGEADSLWREVRPWESPPGRFRGAAARERIARLPGYSLSLRVEAVDPATAAYVEAASWRVRIVATPQDPQKPSREVTGYVP